MEKRVLQSWWREARYGMFIHWGLYAIPAGRWKGADVRGIGEWIMRNAGIPIPEYEALASQFNPTGFDAKEWVQLAVDAGMKYLVITAKHHDGFAMYHSKCSPYNIVDATPFGRDPMKELATACKRAGIPLCFYYSQAQDWHHPDGFGYDPDENKDKNFRRYMDEKCLPQLRELLTQYGDIGLIWFDTPVNMAAEYSVEIRDFVKAIQPNCIVSGRIGNQVGEYVSVGDNFIPLLPLPYDWEVPATLNDTWGFKEKDHHWKSPTDILALLTKINSRGGNYLLNVGPDANGCIPEASAEILRTLGSYLKANGDAIYGTEAAPLYPYDLDWCQLTYKPGRLYVHLLKQVMDIDLPLFMTKVKKATILSTGEELKTWIAYQPASKQKRLHVELPANLPAFGTVVCLELDDDLVVYGTLDNL